MSEIIVATQAAIAQVEVDSRSLQQHPVFLYLAKELTTEGSRITQQSALQRIAQIMSRGQCDMWAFDWGALRYRDTAVVPPILLELYAPKTVNRMLSALKGVLKQCWMLEMMSVEQYQRAIALDAITDDTLPEGRCLSNAEIMALINDCLSEDTPTALRDAAMIALLLAGPRRAEVVGLDLEHYNRETGEVKIIRGKRRKSRITYVSPALLPLVNQWIDEVRGDRPGALLLPSTPRGKQIIFERIKKGHTEPTPTRLTPQTVRNILLARRDRVNARRLLHGQPPIEPFAPHDFRRTFISNLLDAGVDIVTVCHLAGHSDPKTTERYDRRGDEVKQAAVEKLNFSVAIAS